MASDFRSYAIAFLLTLVLEVAVAVALGFRRRLEIGAVIAVNVFSHPLVNYLIWVLGSLRSEALSGVEILPFEAGVVLVEWQLLCFALRGYPKGRLLILSFVMNALSYFAGVVLQLFR
jgi:hypothetical protein